MHTKVEHLFNIQTSTKTRKVHAASFWSQDKVLQEMYCKLKSLTSSGVSGDVQVPASYHITGHSQCYWRAPSHLAGERHAPYITWCAAHVTCDLFTWAQAISCCQQRKTIKHRSKARWWDEPAMIFCTRCECYLL